LLDHEALQKFIGRGLEGCEVLGVVPLVTIGDKLRGSTSRI
jgi:hypothetical protein